MNLVAYTYPRNRVYQSHPDFPAVWDWALDTNPASRSHEDQDNFFVSIDLPGVRKEDVTIKVENDELRITALRRVGNPAQSQDLTYNRTFFLPEEVQVEKISAEQKDGVLTITLPKKEEAKPKTVQISVN